MNLTSHVKFPGSIAVSRFFGVEPYPSHLRSVSVSTLNGLSFSVPWDFHPVGKVCRLRGFCRFLQGMLFLCFCAWRISSNRYKIKRSEWFASASHIRQNWSALNSSEPPITVWLAKSGQTTRSWDRTSVHAPSHCPARLDHLGHSHPR